MSEISYALMDPSKNITILVETNIDIEKQNEVARKLMKLEKTAEQLAFIMSFKEKEIFVRMAGGEFCGNAAMSLACLYAIEHKLDKYDTNIVFYGNEKSIISRVKVSVNNIAYSTYEGIVYMPLAKKIEKISLSIYNNLPMISFDGITHIIIDEEIEKEKAETLIKDWCKLLNLEALGLMFYKKIDDTNYEMKPLVYVRDIDSLFWENACASGSFALGTYLMKGQNDISEVSIKQTGGDVLKIKKDDDRSLCLIGKVKLLSKKTVNKDII